MPTDAALNQFLDFLRFGSISTDSKYKDQVLGCAEWLKNKLTAIGLLWTKWYHSSFWLLCSVSALVMALVLLALLRPLKRAMPGV